MSKVYYRGQQLFLYTRFKDENNNLTSVINPTVTISYEKDGSITELMNSELMPMPGVVGEYYSNYTLDFDASYTFYEIEYSGDYGEGKIARVSESFHIIPKSENFTDAIKIYGFVNQAKLGYPLIGALVRVDDGNRVVYESFTNEEGSWDAFIYPGNYEFTFEKYGFIEQKFNVQIGLEHTEIQFDNVSLESESLAKKGNGVYSIGDNYITREGVPLNGLEVNAYDVFNPATSIAVDVTNNDGEWQLFLDPGLYFLRVKGTSLMDDFEQTFRLRVEDDGQFNLENLTENVGTPISGDQLSIGQGTGEKEVTDSVLDGNGNPIIDVQVCAYHKGDMNTLIAQDYTDPSGKWMLKLNAGDYVLEFYHPEFHEFQEEIKVIKLGS